MPGRNSAHQTRLRRQVAAPHPACHLCGEPIDYKLHWLDPRSFVIDHVIPIARGGADTLDNCRAAHRECNSKKRARLIPPMVRKMPGLNR